MADADAEFKNLTALEGTDQIKFLNDVNAWFDTNTNTIKKKKSFFNFSNKTHDIVLTRAILFQYAQVAKVFSKTLQKEHMY